MRRLTCLVLGLLLIVLTSDAVLAQCSMCKAVLSGANDASFIRSFNLGVLVLLLPPVTIFCSIFVVLRRHRGRSDQD